MPLQPLPPRPGLGGLPDTRRAAGMACKQPAAIVSADGCFRPGRATAGAIPIGDQALLRLGRRRRVPVPLARSPAPDSLLVRTRPTAQPKPAAQTRGEEARARPSTPAATLTSPHRALGALRWRPVRSARGAHLQNAPSPTDDQPCSVLRDQS